MPVPKQRHNKSRGRRRRAGHGKMEAKVLAVCSNCSGKIVPHRVCPFCGYYKGKKVIK